MGPEAQLTIDVDAVARALGAAPRVDPTPTEVWEGLSEEERYDLSVRRPGDCEGLVRLGLMIETRASADGTVYYSLTDLGEAVRDHAAEMERQVFIAKIDTLRTAAADIVDSWGDRDRSDGYPFDVDMYEVVENIDGWIKTQRDASK